MIDSPTITDANLDLPPTFHSHSISADLQPTFISTSGSSPGSNMKPPVPAKDAPKVPPKDGTPPIGHVPDGRTLAIHSLAVLPTHRRRLFGRTIVKSYLQRMESAGIADRTVLIAPPTLLNWFAMVGFRDSGPSTTVMGEGLWRNMVCGFSVIVLPKPSRSRTDLQAVHSSSWSMLSWMF